MIIKTHTIALLCFLFAAPLAAQIPASKYAGFELKCPPCGMECDNTVHERPGACSHCGMVLAGVPADLKNVPPRGHMHRTAGKKVAVLVVDGVQIIDFTGPFEIFGQAGMRVFTVALRDTVVTTAMGMRILPDYTLDNAPDADILLLPGGHVEDQNPRILEWIKKRYEQTSTTFSVCNGAFYLARAGLLDGGPATTFNALIPALQEAAPKAKVVRDQRFTDQGKVVTSAGLSSGMDAAFHILSEYFGVGRAQEVATYLEYNWDARGRYVRASLADRYIRPLDDVLAPFIETTEMYEGDRTQWMLKATLSTQHYAIEKIALLLEYQYEMAMQWTLVKKTGLNTTWVFTDPEKKKWTAVIAFSPKKGTPGLYGVEIAVKRI